MASNRRGFVSKVLSYCPKPTAQGKPNAAFCVTNGSTCGSFGGAHSGSLTWLKQGQVVDVTVDPSTRQVRLTAVINLAYLKVVPLPPDTDEFSFFVSFLQHGVGKRHDGVVSIVPSSTTGRTRWSGGTTTRWLYIGHQ